MKVKYFLLICLFLTGNAFAQGPKMPYKDVGACPFEGCVYREWTARQAVAVRTARRMGAPVTFNLRAGEKVAALSGVDTVDFYNGVCEFNPSRCVGTIVEKAQTQWWVQVRNRAGRVGWTHEPEKFDGKSALMQ